MIVAFLSTRCHSGQILCQ